MHILKLSVYSDQFCTISRKYEWEVFAFVPAIKSIDIFQPRNERNSGAVSKQKDQSVNQTINHLKNACLSFVHTALVLMDYLHYRPASDLICIPHCADYKITLLMHGFPSCRTDGIVE